jgi:ribosomal protein S18 acetylase RimI-like enzyme
MNSDSIMSIEDDHWLTKHLGTPAKALKNPSQSDIPRLASLLESSFFYSIVNSSETPVIEGLIGKGFFISTIKLVLRLDNISFPTMAPHPVARIVLAEKWMEEEICCIAEKVFSKDRFHKDTLIDKSIANRIKAEWIKSYFRSERGTHLFAAICGKELAGFNLIIVKNGCATIDLMGVSTKYQASGIGRHLVVEALSNVEAKTSEVETQIDNYHSLSLYNALGYRIIKSSYCLHRHPNSKTNK